MNFYLYPDTELLGPQYLTVKSSGEARKVWYSYMGVYEKTGEYHNKRPVWSRHDGTQKMFYSNGKFPVTEMTVTILI